MTWTQSLAFPTTDEQFVLGFEAGTVWSRLNENPESLQAVVHSENAEVFLRMAEATGREVSSEDIDERWIRVAFTEAT